MLLKSLVLTLMVSGSLSWASGPNAAASAHREEGASYLAYKARATLMAQGQTPSTATPVDLAKAYGPNKGNLPAATVWDSQSEMATAFTKFRDYRFLERDSRPGFLRRSSWLYPDDGCFARAALAILNLGKWNYAVPKKVFVFGDLSVSTKNSPSGSVTWWYHVAPLVEVAGEKYVLDPAIEPKNPLRLEDWLARMSKKPETLEVAVCGSGAYTPYDACEQDSDGIEAGALGDQGYYLDAEWSRLEELRRDPVNELGELPPWLQSLNLP